MAYTESCKRDFASDCAKRYAARVTFAYQALRNHYYHSQDDKHP